MIEGQLKRVFLISYRAFYVVLLFWIAVLSFGEQFGLQSVGIREILFAALILVGLLGFNYCQVRGKVFCGILTALLFFMIPLLIGVEGAGEFWVHYCNWLIGGEQWNPAWYEGYELVQYGLIVLCSYFLQVLLERLSWVKGLSAVVLLVNLIACMCLEKHMGQTAVSVTLWYGILCFVELTERLWKKQKGDNHREYILRILPFCMVYFLLMCVMPAPEKPYDWQFVKDAYHNIYKKITIWMQEIGGNEQEDFGAAYKGFSEDGRLMSSLIGDDKHLLTLHGSVGLRTNVYLVGKVYDTFDGRQWSQTVTEGRDARLMDTLETLYAVKRYDGDLMENYVFSTGLTVEYKYFHTGHIFAPLKMYRLTGCDYQNSGGNLMFEESKGYGTEYKLTYYQLNVDHPQFYQMAEIQQPESNDIWQEVATQYVPKGTETVSLEDLQQYRQQEYTDYYRKIVLSEEVSAFLEEMTGDAETDVQKLRAIEKALSNLTYSEQPGKLPESIVDESAFLDYFLLESKEGYCSYFATAFVLLARAEGIPARYVEGFCVPVNASKNMIVTSSMAHAWPEVYLEGVGWIPFEPTPGYAQLRYTPWELKSKNNSVTSWETDLDEEELEDEETAFQEELLSEEALKAEQDKNRFWTFFLLLTGAVMPMCGLILLVDRALFYKKYRQMTLAERFEMEVNRNLWLLARLGFVRADTETLSELRERVISQVFRGEQLVALSCYEAYLYGDCQITEELLQIVKTEQSALMKWFKQRRKWYYYVIAVRLSFVKS